MEIQEKKTWNIVLSPPSAFGYEGDFKPNFPYEIVDHKGVRMLKLSAWVRDWKSGQNRLTQVCWLTLEQAEELGKGIVKAVQENGGPKK